MYFLDDGARDRRFDFLLNQYGYTHFFRKTDCIVEQPLYRYRSNISRAVEEIETGKIFISSPSMQNDPFDSSYAVSDEALFEEEYSVSFLLNSISAWMGRDAESVINLWKECSPTPLHEILSVKSFIKQFKDFSKLTYIPIQHVLKNILSPFSRQHREYKIACFSETLTSIPMWAYYANNHEGVCLKYDVDILAPTEDNLTLKTAFSKVYYSEFRPKDLHNEASIVTKSSQWSHEHEWRLICRTTENHVVLPCLSAVYLGVNFNNEKFLDTIVSAIKSRNDNTELYRCTTDHQKYTLKFHRIPL